MPTINKRFNRLETKIDHWYIEQFGGSNDFNHEFQGYIKCKLGHGSGFSVLVPEIVFLGSGFTNWLQPFSFLPNVVIRLEKEVGCSLYIDVAARTTIKVVFTNKDFVKSFRDHSQLFRCRIFSVSDIHEHCSGACSQDSSGDIFLELFHHSTSSNIGSIESSRHFRASAWNIQGTKKVKNTNFVYFTWIDKIIKDGDLRVIAMASNGELVLRKDTAQLPNPLPSNWKTIYKNEIQVLKVYRENTDNRCDSIKLNILCDILSPQQLYMHVDNRGAYYYQITHPFIYRIAVSPGDVLTFGPGKSITSKTNILDYCIVGDACDLLGLQAPYDEEDTTFIMKYEKTNNNFLDYWFENGNQDLYTSKGIAKLEF
jgi:hypothetical protein